ncbi:endo-beta-N-acetylglucosaminidase [Hymenobacter busanensis]|nr:LamG-like jellyroll fold domain-containing protein [Hymenobacter busanensis]QHJ06914.1 PKD domain-containing protein [Hymenobacter busanensis]
MKQLYPRLTLSMLARRLGRALLALPWLLSSVAAQAQLEPAAQYTKLTATQLMAWTATGPTAVPANVSTVPLAARQNSLASQLNPAQSFSHQVNYIPDGMATWAGYLNEQNRFNLYNFTHWQYIDVLTWFDGPVAIPTKPWVETAHRNGVKVIGSVFTSAADVATLIQKDGSGNFIAAQKLVDVAAYYSFDGWFFNQESSVSAANALELRNLLKRLQDIKPAGMEIHWYDAMLPGGTVSYQNALNANNQALLQDGTAKVSDAMFTNYFWSGATNINTSVATANALGRSPFEVYMGADLWPNRSNQSLFTQSAWIDNYFTGGNVAQPKLSLGLFATNLTYNGGLNSFNTNAADYQNFYNTEVRLFAGNDLDVTTADASGWKGFGHYVPVRSVINRLPFETTFSVGQGKLFANNGQQLAKAWTDMSRQSLLPSWQWAKSGTAAMNVGFDFSRAYYAGNSVKLSGSLSGTNSATVKLFQTKLPVAANTALHLTYKVPAAGPSNAKLALWFADNLATPELLDLGSATDTLWNTTTFNLSTFAGRELAVIGVQAVAAVPVAAYRLNLGQLKVFNGTLTTGPTAAFAASATTVTTGQSVTFSNASTNATSYSWTFQGGTPATSTAVFPVVSYATPGTYTVTLTATNAAGVNTSTRAGYITVVGTGSGSTNTALLFDGATKYVDAGTVNLNGAALSLECWVKPTAFKTASPFISSVIGIEDASNTALLRFGDAGVAANKLQFVLTLGTTQRKVLSASTFNANTWYHLAATYDGATMRLYVNGVLDATLAATGNAAASGVFTLGRNYDGTRILNGSIDEVRAWTRVLTPAEIVANACQVSPTAAGLEAYWPLNEGSGTTAVDASGHNHLGTLISMIPSDWSTNVPTQCGQVVATTPGRVVGALQVHVLGNPASGSRATIEIQGAQGQPTTVQLVNTLGAVVLERHLTPNAAQQRLLLPLPGAAGLYVLRVRTPAGTVATKLLRQ